MSTASRRSRCAASCAAIARPSRRRPTYRILSSEVEALTEAAAGLTQALEHARRETGVVQGELAAVREQLGAARRERDELRGQLEIAQRDLDRARELQATGASRVADLERAAAEHGQVETSFARVQGQHANTLLELKAAKAEIESLKTRTANGEAEAERTVARSVTIEAGARQVIEELKTARAEAQRIAKERDQALAAVEAERTRADKAIAAARDEAKKGKKIGAPDDATALSVTKLQRLVDELRGELKQEQEARKELEELLDQNAENLEQTIQEDESRLEALGAGVEDKRTTKPKKSQRG